MIRLRLLEDWDCGFESYSRQVVGLEPHNIRRPNGSTSEAGHICPHADHGSRDTGRMKIHQPIHRSSQCALTLCRIIVSFIDVCLTFGVDLGVSLPLLLPSRVTSLLAGWGGYAIRSATLAFCTIWCHVVLHQNSKLAQNISMHQAEVRMLILCLHYYPRLHCD
jgi:hypothetical protein